MHIVLNIITAL